MSQDQLLFLMPQVQQHATVGGQPHSGTVALERFSRTLILRINYICQSIRVRTHAVFYPCFNPLLDVHAPFGQAQLLANVYIVF